MDASKIKQKRCDICGTKKNISIKALKLQDCRKLAANMKMEDRMA
jgi:hypothetical protein